MKYMVCVEVNVVMNIEVAADSLKDAVDIGQKISPGEFLKARRAKDELIDWEINKVSGVFEN